MKVLQLHNASRSGLPSGESVVFLNEASALGQLGVSVISHETSATLPRRWLGQANVFWSSSAYRQVRALIQQHRPQIVHAHSVLPDLTVSIFSACQSLGVPVVQTLHNYRWLCVEGGLFYQQAFCDACLTRGAWHGILRRCSRKSLAVSSAMTLNNLLFVRSGKLLRIVDRFIAVSRFVQDMYCRGGFPPEKITIKYNGVAVAEPMVAPRDPSISQPTVAFIGRLDVAKGTQLLCELVQRLPHVRFQLAGVGPDEGRLRAAFGNLANVAFLGRLPADEVRDLMRNSDCVIVPSIVPESFGLVAAEAMANGVPVVVSRIGGLAELVDQGRGVAVPIDEGVNGFERAVLELLHRPALHRQLATAGFRFAQEQLSLESTTRQLIAIYEDVIQSKVSSSRSRS